MGVTRIIAGSLLALGADALYSKGSPVELMNLAEFKKKVIGSDGPWMVEFFASWCGHCKQLVPEYEKAAKALKGIVGFAAVEDEAAMAEYGVKGFPSLKFFDNKKQPVDYKGERNAKGMIQYVMKTLNDIVSKRSGVSAGGSSGGSSGGSGGGSGNTVILTDANFDKEVMQDEKNVWFIKFYAPWCGHCKAIAGVWDELANNMKGKVKVGKVDATVEQSIPQRFGVQGFPTIKLFPSGKKTENSAVDYNEGRDLSSFTRFAEKYAAMTLEAEQLLTQGQFDETCSEGNLCLIAFLPHIIESSAKERTKYLAEYNNAARGSGGVPCSYFWSQGGDQYEFEEKLNLGFGFPALIAVSRKKNIFVVHRGSFTESSIRTFITGLSAPKHLNDLPKILPPLVEQKKWDGKDGPKEEEL